MERAGGQCDAGRHVVALSGGSGIGTVKRQGEVSEDATRRLAEMREYVVCKGRQAGMVRME